MKERLNKNPIDYVENTIDFLNGFTEEELNRTNIKDRISIITWARNVVNKHQHLDTVQAKIDIMAHQVKLFMDMFDPLFKKKYLSSRKRKVVFCHIKSIGTI